jgi:hypothetical protein
LPVDLSNINNVRYRPDGKLLAVGYDGNIWLLSDTNGDGIEDKAEPWWNKESLRAPIGAALTPPNYGKGDGIFVSAKDKLVLIVDTNKDDRADQEITVATWTERSEQQGVDALGVAVAPDGAVYFSLGAASFTEPYLMDRTTGQARYRTTMERGTIQKVSPDFSKRETVCTGIRFAVGMAFNKEGDLFCTDQEGATWVPNGILSTNCSTSNPVAITDSPRAIRVTSRTSLMNQASLITRPNMNRPADCNSTDLLTATESSGQMPGPTKPSSPVIPVENFGVRNW